MARPSWTNIPSTDTDVDSFVDEDLMTALADNPAAGRIILVPLDIAETTTTSTSYVTAATVYLYVPTLGDYSGIQRRITFEFDHKITSGGTSSVQITDSGSATSGTAATTTSTSYVSDEAYLDIDSGWQGTVRTILIEHKSDNVAYTAYFRAPDRVSARFEF